MLTGEVANLAADLDQQYPFNPLHPLTESSNLGKRIERIKRMKNQKETDSFLVC